MSESYSSQKNDREKTRVNKTFLKNSLIIDTEVDLNIENIIILEDHF